jgi:GTP pyrophosphokinase
VIRFRRRSAAPVSPPTLRGVEDVVGVLRLQRGECDHERVSRAWTFTERAHEGQNRLSGAPFETHPLAVGFLLASQGFDETSAVVGLLHDTVEDTAVTSEDLRLEFGDEVAELVEGVTKIGRHSYVRRDEVQAETFRKLILASARDVRVILVKLADRLHNMMTLEHLPAEDRRRIALETLEIYAPIAHRLGMAQVKGDLEDLAFFHLWPRQWSELQGEVQQRLKGGRRLMHRLVGDLESRLGEEGIGAEISFRVKRMWSIYQKLRRQGIDISQLYDYLAVRVVTETRSDTYRTLGVVHERWRPVPGRFKDYLAMPKPNGYRSLHTTVIADHGQPFEVQIRTREMDDIAERGIAAHWVYKRPTPGRDGRAAGDENVRWLRQVVEWQGEVADPRTFMASLKMDLYPDEVYVFTPKGEVQALPRGATPVDFAYRVHTEIGDHCAGARVNGRVVPLRTPLRNGDQVEILVEPGLGPQRDWLSFVATPRAKARIRQRLNLEARRRAKDLGGRLLEQEARRMGTTARRVLDILRSQQPTEGEAFDADDLQVRIGWGKVAAREVVERVQGQLESRGRLGHLVDRLRSGRADLIAVGADTDLLVRRASCCQPLPGDEIVGVVSRKRGVVVHARGCAQVAEIADLPTREVEVQWEKGAIGPWPVTLRLRARPEAMVAPAVTAAAAQVGVVVLGVAAGGEQEGEVELRIAVRSRAECQAVVAAVEALADVAAVELVPGAHERSALRTVRSPPG